MQFRRGKPLLAALVDAISALSGKWCGARPDHASMTIRSALPLAASNSGCSRHALRLAPIFLLWVTTTDPPAFAQTGSAPNIAAGIARLVKVYPQLKGVEGNT